MAFFHLNNVGYADADTISTGQSLTVPGIANADIFLINYTSTAVRFGLVNCVVDDVEAHETAETSHQVDSNGNLTIQPNSVTRLRAISGEAGTEVDTGVSFAQSTHGTSGHANETVYLFT